MNKFIRDVWRRVRTISKSDVAHFINTGGATILAVRKRSEYEAEYVTNALNVQLDGINSTLTGIEKDKTHFVHYASGYRSMIFTSILNACGYENLINIKGGFKAIKQYGAMKISQYVCPSTI